SSIRTLWKSEATRASISGRNTTNVCPVSYRLSGKIRYRCMLTSTIFSNIILNCLRKQLPMISMRSLNPFFKATDYEKYKQKNRQSLTHGSIQIHIPYTYGIYGKERENG